MNRPPWKGLRSVIASGSRLERSKKRMSAKAQRMTQLGILVSAFASLSVPLEDPVSLLAWICSSNLAFTSKMVSRPVTEMAVEQYFEQLPPSHKSVYDKYEIAKSFSSRYPKLELTINDVAQVHGRVDALSHEIVSAAKVLKKIEDCIGPVEIEQEPKSFVFSFLTDESWGFKSSEGAPIVFSTDSKSGKCRIAARVIMGVPAHTYFCIVGSKARFGCYTEPNGDIHLFYFDKEFRCLFLAPWDEAAMNDVRKESKETNYFE